LCNKTVAHQFGEYGPLAMLVTFGRLPLQIIERLPFSMDLTTNSTCRGFESAWHDRELQEPTSGRMDKLDLSGFREPHKRSNQP